MAEQDPKKANAVDLVATMGWEPLPYDTVGMARPTRVSDTRIIWSWIVLIPWAVNDSKPWIDGAEIIDNPLMKNGDQKERVFTVMRAALDARYGEAVGSRAVDDLIKKLQDEA